MTSENSQRFLNAGGKTKKNEEKTAIFVQNMFLAKLIILFSCDSKTKNCGYLKFSPNVYIRVIYTWYNFWKLLTFSELFIDNLNFQLFLVFFSEKRIKKIWLAKKSWNCNKRFLISCTNWYTKKIQRVMYNFFFYKRLKFKFLGNM